MTRSDLNDEYKKKFDQLVDQMMKEIEQIKPLKRAGYVLSQHHEGQRRNIEKKYFPLFRELFEQASQEVGINQ